jgi:hypothetical protein
MTLDMFVKRWGNAYDEKQYRDYLYDDMFSVSKTKYKIASDNVVLRYTNDLHVYNSFKINGLKYDNNLSNKNLYGLNACILESYELDVEGKVINLPKVVINLIHAIKVINHTDTESQLAVEFVYLNNMSKNIITTDPNRINQKLDEIINQIVNNMKGDN